LGNDSHEPGTANGFSGTNLGVEDGGVDVVGDFELNPDAVIAG